jgi:molecular chaperone GrpE (heat shock protein)
MSGGETREHIQSILADLDRKEAEFEDQTARAEAEFAAKMAEGRKRFRDGIQRTREQLNQALRDLK